MSVRRLVVCAGVVAVAMILPAVPTYAAAVDDVYVTATGVDNGDCSLASPCATVAAAVFAADSTGTTIHVGAGTFDGPIRPGALSKSVSIVGVSAAATVLTNSGLDGFVVEVDSGTTSLSDLTAHGGLASTVLVDGTGTLLTDHVVLETAQCVLAVFAGEAHVTDSTLQNGGSTGCDPPGPDPLAGDVAMSGGSVSLVRTQVRNPQPLGSGAKVKGGTFTADQSSFDDSNAPDRNQSDGVQVDGGTATITRSTFHGFASSGVRTLSGTAYLGDDTFWGNVVGVTGTSGSTTVVRSTFEGELASLQSTVAIAGSVLGPDSLKNCGNATITDLGYNLATDDTCGFTTATSHGNVTGLHVDTAAADHGGPLPTVAILSPSTAVDVIPAGATYGLPQTPLCPATGSTDLRGVPRPQAGACDAGSTEMVATTTALTSPANAKPHAVVALDATVGVTSVGVDGVELPTGTITFTAGTTVLCSDVPVLADHAGCTASAIPAGKQLLLATFTPTAGSTLHGALSPTRTIEVGTVPAFTTKPRAAFVVGRAKKVTVHASGAPAARITLLKGRLPAGLHFRSGSGKATISGKAKIAALGSHTVTVRAMNLLGTVRQTLRIVVTRH